MNHSSNTAKQRYLYIRQHSRQTKNRFVNPGRASKNQEKQNKGHAINTKNKGGTLDI